MPITIDNQDVERLLNGIVQATGETRAEALRKALADRYRRLAAQSGQSERAKRLRAFLEEEVWPLIPADQRGKRLSREEEEAILGLGEQGV